MQASNLIDLLNQIEPDTPVYVLDKTWPAGLQLAPPRVIILPDGVCLLPGRSSLREEDLKGLHRRE